MLNFAQVVGESASKRSTYYQIGDKVIRVSDHIGKNSDGTFQIIVRPNGYLIYHPSTGTINICDYRQVQEFIRVFSLFPVNEFSHQKIVVAKENEGTILGVPASAFTPNQLNMIISLVKKIKK